MKATILMLTAIILSIILLGFMIKLEYKSAIPEETAIQLATTITVLRPSFLTIQDIDKYVKNTGLANFGSAFIYAEQTSGIGADYLVSIAMHESRNGTNVWWKDWNNCFSWGITDSGPNSEAYKIKEMTKFNAIVYTAKQIKALYLTKGGAYYKGETLGSIGTFYASDGSWASAVINIHTTFVKLLPEQIQAKQWIMGAKILNGDLPSPVYFTADYFMRPLTREEISTILYRINGR